MKFGAWMDSEGVRFSVWAPAAATVEVCIQGAEPFPLDAQPNGVFTGYSLNAQPGDLYTYRLNGELSYPDPASRFQPQGVDGPSEIVAPRNFAWKEGQWPSPDDTNLVIYELHIGTFTTAGTFKSAAAKLEHIHALGATAIEVMPIAEFPGDRGWGYDGVGLWAPYHRYGRPEDFRELVDTAHRLGLSVILDVVYNHFGPSGNYTGAFSNQFLSERHHSPWGARINLDGPGSEMVRGFFIQNALHWIHEYHLDGLRFDATHALEDDSPTHFVAELVETLRRSSSRKLVLIAEDHRNEAKMLLPKAAGGWGLDAVWADDFHHQVERKITGSDDGYYRDYAGSTEDIAKTMNQGWFFAGQPSELLDSPRGTSTDGLPPSSFVYCLQNHDQVGNRAFGTRMSTAVAPEVYRAVTTLLLLAPQTPLLFMGQEWAASTPFCYFTDHEPELGMAITAGRRQEFRHFNEFADPAFVEAIPDPQSRETFQRSKLDWTEVERSPHQEILTLHQALLALRRRIRNLDAGAGVYRADALSATTLALTYGKVSSAQLLLVVHLGAGEKVGLEKGTLGFRGAVGAALFSTEDPEFCRDGRPPVISQISDRASVEFARAGAVLMGCKR